HAWNLGHKDVPGRDVVAYVNWDIGWPSENSSGSSKGKGETPSAKKGMEPGPSLGKAVLKLDGLLKKAEIHEVLELYENRKPTGGKLEVRIRLQTPLDEAEVVTRTEKWLIIDEFNRNNPVFSALQTLSAQNAKAAGISVIPSTPTSTPSQTPTSSTSTRADSISTSSQQRVPQPPSTTAKTTTRSNIANPARPEREAVQNNVAQKDAHTQNKILPQQLDQGKNNGSSLEKSNELEQAEEELNNVDNLISNLVLEKEMGLVDSQIDTFKKQHKPVPEDLIDRKQALEIKMSLLVIQVESGQLTMDQYIAQVKASILKHKKLALTFKGAGKLDGAKQALARSKIMEKEVKEVEDAMANGPLVEE
ncbi:6053_t:CDS:2, partial [Paraglomus brasilianum]